MLHRLTILTLTLALAVSACGGGDDSGQGDTLEVIATTTILGDIAAHVVGDAGTVTTLLPVGTDPHDYQASAQQAAAIATADLVIANGLGLEEGLSDLLDSAAADGANIIEIAPLVDPIPFGAGVGDETAPDHGSSDPHFWFDPLRDATAAHLIAAELTAVDPSVAWTERATAFADELAAADTRIAGILSAVPAANRRLVTNHDAFGYLAQRYSFEVIGAVIPGGSTLAEPSSAELTALVDRIKTEAVTAIFAESTEPSVLADALAAEAGETVNVVELYTGSLGEPGSGADTLIGMLLADAQLIADALAPASS